MNKYLLILILPFLLFQSCSSNNDESEIIDDSPESLFFKKWYRVSSSYDGKTFYHNPCSDGSRDYIQFSKDFMRSYHVNGSNDCSYSIEKYTWSREGDVINLFFLGKHDSIWTITELSESTFSISIEGVETGVIGSKVFSSN